LYDFAATIVKDAANFNRLQVYTFDAYGNLLSIGGQQLPTSNFPLQTSFLPLTTYLYSGESFDFNIGQQYLRARFYDATTGRFNRLDPFAGNTSDPQSFHKYGYVHGDPIHGIDPTGMFLSALGGFTITAAVNGAILGAVAGAAGGALDAYLGGENAWEGAAWGGAIGGTLGFLTGGFSAPLTAYVQGLSVAQKLIAFRSMYFLTAAAAGWGIGTAKNGWQATYRGTLGLMGAVFNAAASRQFLKDTVTWTNASFASRLSRSSLNQYAEAFEALGQRIDEAVGTAAAFLRSSVRQDGRHLIGEDEILRFFYGKVPPGKKAPEALLEGVNGYRGVEVKNQISADVGHSLQKFESVSTMLREKGLAAEGFDIVVSKSKFRGFNDRNYSIGPNSQLTYMGSNVSVGNAPVSVLVVDLPN
jgi:RHS repeat-associated protein